MLAQSPPQLLFPSNSGTKRKYSLSMDLSPSQLVAHSYRPPPRNIEVANVGTHTSPFDFRALLQAAAQADSGGPVHGMQNRLDSILLAHASQVLDSKNPSSEQAINLRALLPPLVIGENMTGTEQHSLGESATPSSSSLSSTSQPQDFVYSRRSSGNNETPPQSAPAESSLFYRNANFAARQRTSQACDKCRERKTKCTGSRPVCKRCTDRGLKCVWSSDTRVRGPAKPSIDLHDNMGDLAAVVPVPLSKPASRDSTPLIKAQDYIHSAPAAQTTFSSIPLPANYLMNNRHENLHGGMNHPTGVAKGANAHCVMGEPITTLCSADDCWFPVGNAVVETPSRVRSGTFLPRERASSVSVAHLARARNLHRRARPTSEVLPARPFDQHSVGLFSDARRNESSPSLQGIPQPTPVMDTFDGAAILSLPELLHSYSEYELQQTFASYGCRSQLDEEMTKLLHFPGGGESEQAFDQGLGSGSVDGVYHPSVSRTHYMEESTAEVIMPPPAGRQSSKEEEDDLIAQYFDADAFDKILID